jgi:murein DD-endopeptidase MepM/ murein hydrolase activator NlpD
MSIDTLGRQLAEAAKSATGGQDAAAKARQQAKLREACRMFESSFLQTLWKEMRATLPKGGLMNGGKGEEMFTGMLDQARADQAVKGRSTGLADLLERQLSRERFKTVPASLDQPSLKPLQRGLWSRSYGAATGAGAPAPTQAEEQAAEAPGGDAVTLPMPSMVDMDGEKPLGADTPVAELSPASTRPSSIAPQRLEPAEPARLSSPTKQAAPPAPAARSGQKGSPAVGVTDYQPPIQGEISSTFGLRVHPVSGEVRPHRGLDLAAPEGTPFQAARSGVVRFSGQFGEYGNLAVVEHDDGSQAYYGHCRSIKVRTGQKVSQGQTLGQVGMTGVATGPHLHFEVRDAAGEAVDPLPLVAGGLGLSA